MKSKKLKVQIVAPVSPYREFGGGIVTCISNIVNHLKHAIEFRLIGARFEGDSTKRYKLTFIDFLSVVDFRTSQIKKKSSLIFAFGIFKNKKKIKNNNSIFHVQRTDSALPLLYPSKVKNPLIIHIHGSNTYWRFLDKNSLFMFFVSLIEYLTVRRSDKVIMVSKKGLVEYHSLYPKYKNKIIYIPNGIDIHKFFPMNDKAYLRNKFNIPLNKKVILYTGRFVTEKGIKLILDSFSHIEKKIDNCLMIFVGDGPLKSIIKEYSKENGNIWILLPVSNEQMPYIYNLSDILVMASYFEGWSNTLGEALACGIPAVTTNVGDAEELIQNGKNGYIVYSRDPYDFAEKCVSCLEKSDIMRKNARYLILPYSLDNMATKLLEVYRGVQK